MKVIDVFELKTEIVETDEKECSTYRRCGVGVWEVLMGESWEPHYYCSDIEEAYQEYKAKNGNQAESEVDTDSLRSDKQK